MIGLENHIAATAAVAAARTALGAVRFTLKSHAAFAAMTSSGKYSNLINEHRWNYRGSLMIGVAAPQIILMAPFSRNEKWRGLATSPQYKNDPG
jgi:hypothetical protein